MLAPNLRQEEIILGVAVLPTSYGGAKDAGSNKPNVLHFPQNW